MGELHEATFFTQNTPRVTGLCNVNDHVVASRKSYMSCSWSWGLEGACLVTGRSSAARVAALLRVPGCQTGRLAPARSNPTSSSTGLSTLSIQPQRTQRTHTSHAVPAGAPHVMLSTFRNLNSHALRHRMTPHELMRGAGPCVQPHTCLACSAPALTTVCTLLQSTGCASYACRTTEHECVLAPY